MADMMAREEWDGIVDCAEALEEARNLILLC